MKFSKFVKGIRPKLSRTAVAGLALAALGSGVLPASPVSAGVVAGGAFRIGMPFSGGFDQFGLANPANHHVFGGQFATDIYAPPNTVVAANIVRAGTGASITMKVTAVTPVCRGTKVELSLYNYSISSTTPVGKVTFSHLDKVRVSVGQGVVSGTPLGITQQWSYQTGCWEVTNNSGVHTHLEVSQLGGFSACWTMSARANLAAGTKIAVIGGTDVRARSACPSIAPYTTA